MIVGEAKLNTYYYRTLKGRRQKCWTTCTVYSIRCDNCEQLFTRTAKEINRSSSAHCCNQCDPKRFAQRQSSILRKFNKWDASSGLRL